MGVVVVAAVPGRVQADGLALQRAMENGSACALPEMLMWVRAMPGCCSNSASAVMPPIELPTRQASCWIPSARTTSAAALAMSSTDNSGNDSR